ncbi:flippase [Halobacteriales archaeon Cl-PHB]
MADAESALESLLSSATLVAVGGLVGAFSKLVERIVIGRSLSPAAYGEVSIGIVVMSIGATLSLVGLGQATSRFMSRYDDPADVRGIWLSGLLVAGSLAVGVAGLLYLGSEPIVATLFGGADSMALLTLFVLTVPFTVAFRIGVNAIRGFENTVYRTVTKDLLFPFVRIGGVVVLLALGFDVLAVGYAYLGATALAALVAFYLVNRLLPLVGPVRTHVREMTRFGAPLVIATMLSLLLIRTDTLMVGFFRDSAEVGQYSAAYPLANGLLIVLSAFGFLYLPLASRLDADDEREEIDRIYATTTKWVYVVTFPAFLTFVVFPTDVLRIFFGAEYVQAAPALVLLSLGFFANALGGRNRETVSALGHTKYLMVANGSAYALNVGLNVVLITRFGFVGAAVASAVALGWLNALVVGILISRFDISPFSTQSVRTFVALPLLLLPPALVLAQWVSLTALTIGLFLVGTGLVTLVVVALVGGLQPEDGVVVRFVEDAVGVEIPFVRSYLPTE